MVCNPSMSTLDDHRFPCTSCGSDLRFDPADGLMRCDYCGHTEPAPDSGPWQGNALTEQDLAQALAGQLPQADVEHTRTSRCPNCGAETAFGPDIHSADCPFCATPVVTDTGTNRHIKPKGVLPFALTESQARAAMTDWLGGLWFAPRGLLSYARKGRRMDGVYIPYWTFDAQTRSHYHGERGDDYYETRTVTRNGEKQTVKVRRTDWSPARGTVRRFFDDVLVLASTSLPERFTKGLLPWDLSELDPYQPDYLAGFRAEAYQVELPDAYTEARNQMDRQIKRDVRFDIGGDRQRIHGIDTQVSDASFKHILLPVWIAAYRYRGRSYRFVVNGRTGRVQGERPWSAWKIALAVLAALAVAAAAGYFYAINEGMLPPPRY